MDQTRSQQLRGGTRKYTWKDWLADERRIMFGAPAKSNKVSQSNRRRDSVGSPVLSKLHSPKKYSSPVLSKLHSPKEYSSPSYTPPSFTRKFKASPAKSKRNYKLPKPKPFDLLSPGIIKLRLKPRAVSPANRGFFSPDNLSPAKLSPGNLSPAKLSPGNLSPGNYSDNSPTEKPKRDRRPNRELRNLETNLIGVEPTGSRKTRNSRNRL